MKRLLGSLLKWFRRILLGLGLLILLSQLWYLGWVVWWKYTDPGMTRFMEIRLSEARQKNPQAQIKRHWLPYNRISVHLKRAVVAAEDDKFILHDGFDWEGMQLALEKNRKKGRVVAGGSTISQQLAKNLFLSPVKTPWRKAQEAVITLMLETVWDKRRILEVYLNSVEWGDGVFGAEAAARHYYKIGAAQLSAPQAARLAVILPAPRRFEKNLYSAYLNRRTQRILARLPNARLP
ncbi:MAG: monofunctional biosynthetic peptidoglycan transglycosylase [Sterolibacterium sp.]|nr:monofunctional biosynthetic peptidoglycan transglycosylase [Sterolibacterium sp.]